MMIKQIENEKVIELANNFYSLKATELKVVEESAELIQAIIKRDPENILEEYVDLCIILTRFMSYMPLDTKKQLQGLMVSKFEKLSLNISLDKP